MKWEAKSLSRSLHFFNCTVFDKCRQQTLDNYLLLVNEIFNYYAVLLHLNGYPKRISKYST